jgi:hypothetical protein
MTYVQGAHHLYILLVILFLSGPSKLIILAWKWDQWDQLRGPTEDLRLTFVRRLEENLTVRYDEIAALGFFLLDLEIHLPLLKTG